MSRKVITPTSFCASKTSTLPEAMEIMVVATSDSVASAVVRSRSLEMRLSILI
jgi:hypothetical protein